MVDGGENLAIFSFVSGWKVVFGSAATEAVVLRSSGS